ncbi:MAG: hypothetical protein JKX78_06180 [Alteromonadaceae bacterium]|nr:hypothetical protein [Alteromonadaceae bacterium]
MIDEKKINTLLITPADNAIANFVFAHGAGADMHHQFMIQVSELLAQQQINVIRFNFTYMNKRLVDGKRYPPDRMPKLLHAYQETLTKICQDQKNNEIDFTLPLFIGGKSMGSRVAATLLASDEFNELSANIKGLVCLGYPFHPQKKTDKLRLEPLLGTQKPSLIIQGDRDALGNKEEVLSYELPSQYKMVFLEDGDHSFKPRIKSGFTLQQHITSAVQHIVSFINEHS